MTNHPRRAQVITWASPDNLGRINLTVPQERQLREAGVWPKDRRGREYCRVSHGLHTGEPTFSADEFAALIEALKA